MQKVYFKYSHIGSNTLDTDCPYYVIPRVVWSNACTSCPYYMGKFKNEKAIQCSGDDNKEEYNVIDNNLYKFKKEYKFIVLDKFLLIEKKVII
jgi:hypothetical protein